MINRIMLQPVWICALLLVSGCSLFGSGSDDSRMTITNKGCEVEISQHGKVKGLEGTEFSEDITVAPDCSVTVNVKDGVKPATQNEEVK